ncbi:hypothetical protein L2E82_52162 [Cichorium intybus]|nr:hypothetical protein L2E82_52162 [Cichorium intybus]
MTDSLSSISASNFFLVLISPRLCRHPNQKERCWSAMSDDHEWSVMVRPVARLDSPIIISPHLPEHIIVDLSSRRDNFHAREGGPDKKRNKEAIGARLLI